jgi:hypothetical protein
MRQKIIPKICDNLPPEDTEVTTSTISTVIQPLLKSSTTANSNKTNCIKINS